MTRFFLVYMKTRKCNTDEYFVLVTDKLLKKTQELMVKKLLAEKVVAAAANSSYRKEVTAAAAAGLSLLPVWVHHDTSWICGIFQLRLTAFHLVYLIEVRKWRRVPWFKSKHKFVIEQLMLWEELLA